MDSNNAVLRSTTTLFLLFCTLSSIVVAVVLDTDGEELRNGGKYYIVPLNIGFGGGLSLQSKDKDSPCPLFITRDSDETNPGIPVTISSPAKIAVITTTLPISIVFQDTPNICMQPLGWQVIKGQSYITTGGAGLPFNPLETFKIQQFEEEEKLYKIHHVAEESDVGIFMKDGFLGINSDIALPVVFRKAFDDVLAMKVSY